MVHYITATCLILLSLSTPIEAPVNHQLEVAELQADPCKKYQSTLKKHLSKLQKVTGKKLLFRTYVGFAEKTLAKIKKKCPNLDVSAEEQQLASIKGEQTADKAEASNDEQDYFKNIYTRLPYVYTKADVGAAGTDGLKFFSTHKNLEKAKALYGDFSKADYLSKVEQAKQDGTYEKHRFFIDRTVNALNDYPRFIDNSASTFNEYVGYLNNTGVKGDAQQELKHLNAAKDFCQLLLCFAPAHSKASAWLRQVEKKMQAIGGSISYASTMHRDNLGKLLFSNKQVPIGNETTADFSNSFQSGDPIFATIYLPSKLRAMTDSYVINNMEVKVNGMMVDEGSRTAICVNTPMQEKNYLQFAIIPDASWTKQYAKLYADHDMFTHESIARALVDAGPYSDISVDIRVIFRGTRSDVKGSFTIDQSGGIEAVQQVLVAQENKRYANATLPKAGMRNAELEQAALEIMRKKTNSSSGKVYQKAIIVSKDWDYDKSWAGVTVSRSLVMALTSKEFDGKCMYQLFTFFQQEKGNGTFSNTLEFGGAGENTYTACENLD
ncbi:MAG: hypothetical protein AAF798_12960 [Bacteroidota bacterium]